ncbi:hypothetical protein ACQEV9_15445 [Streptomyces chartreusis]|uniref:hypothetical protein n=1 Tax=Streptomyces chartreusis TaxID=1969 RepID=UPI003D9463C8
MSIEDGGPIMPPKVRTFASAAELADKLSGKAALWHRTALENEERAVEFDRAAELIVNGAKTVTVGRTTYRVGQGSDNESHG